jgi:hypothetical protein
MNEHIIHFLWILTIVELHRIGTMLNAILYLHQKNK